MENSIVQSFVMSLDKVTLSIGYAFIIIGLAVALAHIAMNWRRMGGR